MLYLPCATLLFEWFIERRGLATGIMFSGAAVGGTLFPLLSGALLPAIGFRSTLLVLAAIFAVLDGAALVFIRNRVPLAPRVRTRNVSWRHITSWRPAANMTFLRRRAVWAMWAFVTLTGLVNFIPSLWIPSTSSTLDAPG